LQAQPRRIIVGPAQLRPRSPRRRGENGWKMVIIENARADSGRGNDLPEGT